MTHNELAAALKTLEEELVDLESHAEGIDLDIDTSDVDSYADDVERAVQDLSYALGKLSDASIVRRELDSVIGDIQRIKLEIRGLASAVATLTPPSISQTVTITWNGAVFEVTPIDASATPTLTTVTAAPVNITGGPIDAE